MAYVIIDLFSRYVVGWMVATEGVQAPRRAALRRDHRAPRHRARPRRCTADRGSAMKSDTLAQLLASLGASRSFSRPRVSDDNAFSEAQFKTLKYQPDYPGRFDGELHARAWLQRLLRLAQRRPPPLGPRALHARRGLLRTRRDRRARHAKRRSTPRTPRTPSASLTARPRSALPPAAVHINPLTADALTGLPARRGVRRSTHVDRRNPRALDRIATPTCPRGVDRNIEFSCRLSHAR